MNKLAALLLLLILFAAGCEVKKSIVVKKANASEVFNTIVQYSTNESFTQNIQKGEISYILSGEALIKYDAPIDHPEGTVNPKIMNNVYPQYNQYNLNSPPNTIKYISTATLNVIQIGDDVQVVAIWDSNSEGEYHWFMVFDKIKKNFQQKYTIVEQ